MSATTYYYPEEMYLFEFFGVSALTELALTSPMDIYTEAIMRAFLNNVNGPEVEALKRAVRHFRGGGARCNEYFNNLIRVENETSV